MKYNAIKHHNTSNDIFFGFMVLTLLTMAEKLVGLEALYNAMVK